MPRSAASSFAHSPRGFKLFFVPLLLDTPAISIAGLGIREHMPPSFIRRPRGREDYLFMLFHDPATMQEEEPSAGGGALLRADTMMIWPPGAPQYYGNVQNSYRHSWLHCQGRRIDRILRRCGLPVLQPFAVPLTVIFEQGLQEIYHQLADYAQPDEVIVGNAIENMLRSLARSTATDPRGKQNIPENLLAVRRLIASSPAQAISLTEMASLAGMSVSHFSARFRECFGVAPVECLIQQRIHYAAHLLDNRSLTIAEISAMSGYEDPFQFSRIFKKHMGKSPRDYRLGAGTGTETAPPS